MATPPSAPLPDRTVQTDGRVYATEFWAGRKLRWERLHVGGGVLLELAGTVGLSAVTRFLGRERQRAIDEDGDAHLLYYFAPELGLSFERLPSLELVVRVPHRSGGDRTLGHMEEGYNADVVGVRYSF